MAKQRVFRQRYLDRLFLNVKSGHWVDYFRNNEIHTSEEDLLINPNIEQPDGLLKSLIDTQKDDYLAAIALYDAFKNLTLLEAADPRLWNYLSLIDLFPYVSIRWPDIKNRKFSDKNKEIEYIQRHFLQKTSADLMVSHLSGLWWSISLSIDAMNENDPYHLSKILFWSQDARTRTLGTELLGRSKNIMHGVLLFLQEHGKEQPGGIDKNVLHITKFLNNYGGAKPLSFLHREEIKNLIERDLYSYS